MAGSNTVRSPHYGALQDVVRILKPKRHGDATGDPAEAL